MDSLQRLAEHGQAEFPPGDFPDLLLACREAVRSTGQGRYAVIADMIEVMDTAWSQYEMLPYECVQALDGLLATELPMILNEPSEEAAVSLAASLFESVRLAVSRA